MPGPLPLRGVAAVHQRRFPSIDDEKVSISMASASSTSSPASSSFDSSSISISQKRSRQEVHKLVREAMVRGVQPHAPTHFSTHTVDFEKAPVSSARSLPSNGSSKNRGNVKTQGQDPTKQQQQSKIDANVKKSDDQFVCFEIGGGGARWKYTLKQQASCKEVTAFNVVNASSTCNPLNDLVTFVKSCVVPDGYPDSVSSSYTPYMQWRALKYLFGGAMSVFTTRSLLHAVGVSRNGATSTAMAVNWVIKDGAGRIGKLLFARQGKKFDYDMKQLRFTGDLLMELGAAVELATVAAPHLFLPLACAANVAKNVAAVASTSTRAPIYKAFARGENIGDVTAKGECISNIADLIGTGLGIFISKSNPSLMTTFAILSCGYLCCSYNEIKSVCLPTLNRARFKSAVHSFLETGKVPSLVEGNRNESIFMPPWAKDKPFVVGARLSEAFQNPTKFLELLPVFQDEKYLLTYNPKRRQTFVVLKEAAGSDDVLRASFHAQVVERIFQRSANVQDNTDSLSDIRIDAVIRESCKDVHQLFDSFRVQAISQGWVLGESLLNPGMARLCY